MIVDAGRHARRARIPQDARPDRGSRWQRPPWAFRSSPTCCHTFRATGRACRTGPDLGDLRHSAKPARIQVERGSAWRLALAAINAEIAEWLKQIRVSWLGELRHPFAPVYRFGFAASGATTFALYHGTPLATSELLTQPAQQALANIVTAGTGTLLNFVVNVVLIVGTGTLVAWRPRKSGPIRLFFDGILLPTGVAALLGF